MMFEKLFEGQPTLLCEASMLGVASIFPRNGGISEFFPESYQLSFSSNDYKELEEKLNLLLNSELIVELGKKNKNFIESKLNQEKTVDKLIKIIDE